MSLRPDPQNPDPDPIDRIRTSSGAERPVTIAHRCGGGLGPENTCEAVVQSSFYRPDYYEIDIRHTSDGVPVCIHDATLDRTTNIEGQVSEMTFEEIRKADAGSWFGETFENARVPAFSEMLDRVNPSPLVIELKEADITSEQCRVIADILSDANDHSSVVISFLRSALETYGEVDPDRRTGYLVRELDEYALEGPHDLVGVAGGALDQGGVNRLIDAEKVIFVYTVNEDYGRFIEMGVDGIVTDYPDRLRKAIPPG